jgi:peptidoglycan/LPS O-acetylase OafA/YrhL
MDRFASLRRFLMLSDAGRVEPDLGRHLPVLDGVRGVAILLVLVHHFVREPLAGATSLVDEGLHRLTKAGWVGVDLFFVLSGFLITGILLDTKHAQNYFRSFYARRALRILPAYYLFIVLCLTLVPLLVPHDVEGKATMVRDQIWFWTHLMNIYLVFVHHEWPPFSTAHLWSLAIEEQFYLLWPLAVFLFRPQTVTRLAIAMLCAAPVLRVVLLAFRGHPVTFAGSPLVYVANYMLLPCRMDSLAAGALVASLVRSVGVARCVPWARRIALIAGGVLAAGFLAQRGVFDWYMPVVQAAGYSVLAAFFASVIVLAISHGRGTLSDLLTSRPLLFFGRYSYALYLFHMLPVLVLTELGFREHLLEIVPVRALAALVYAAVATAMVVGLALLSWNLMEKRFLAMKRFFPVRYPLPKPAPEAAMSSPTV